MVSDRIRFARSAASRCTRVLDWLLFFCVLVGVGVGALATVAAMPAAAAICPNFFLAPMSCAFRRLPTTLMRTATRPLGQVNMIVQRLISTWQWFWKVLMQLPVYVETWHLPGNWMCVWSWGARGAKYVYMSLYE